MNKFIRERNKKFIIIGIDNAFTIDEDVRQVWTDSILNFDMYKNINILQSLCKKNNITFINGLSILEKKNKKQVKRFIIISWKFIWTS